MKHYYINVFYSEVDEGYIADIPELGDCSAFGKTLEETLRKILLAQAAWLEAAQAKGKQYLLAGRNLHSSGLETLCAK